MAVIRPFQCVRPEKSKAARVAALPYDVYNRQEAKEEVLREPMSFLKIDRAETSFDDSVDTYAPEVYKIGGCRNFLLMMYIKKQKNCSKRILRTVFI